MRYLTSIIVCLVFFTAGEQFQRYLDRPVPHHVIHVAFFTEKYA